MDFELLAEATLWILYQQHLREHESSTFFLPRVTGGFSTVIILIVTVISCHYIRVAGVPNLPLV